AAQRSQAVSGRREVLDTRAEANAPSFGLAVGPEQRLEGAEIGAEGGLRSGQGKSSGRALDRALRNRPVPFDHHVDGQLSRFRDILESDILRFGSDPHDLVLPLARDAITLGIAGRHEPGTFCDLLARQPVEVSDPAALADRAVHYGALCVDVDE